MAAKFGGKIAENLRSVFNEASNEAQDEGRAAKIRYIPLNQIDTFKDHPFRVRDDAEMEQLVESIRESGVLTPATVREKDDGRYEMISGHRRKHACELAGLSEIPAIVVQMDDDDAVIRMVDANLQRENILPSNKAFAYQMKLEAVRRKMDRKAGRPSKDNSSQVGMNYHGKQALDMVSDSPGESRNQVHRYIRLTHLIAPLLDMVDERQLPFMTGVTLSYLTEVDQTALLRIMSEESVTPSLQQAEEMKKCSQKACLDGTMIRKILFPERFAKPMVKAPDERRAERKAEAVRREQEEAELEAREARVTEQVRMDFAQLQRNDPDEEPLTITTGKEPGDAPIDNTLHVFFQAAEETHEAMLDQANAEKIAMTVCKRLDSLQGWFEANADKDTLDRFLDVVGDLGELLHAQGLLKK